MKRSHYIILFSTVFLLIASLLISNRKSGKKDKQNKISEASDFIILEEEDIIESNREIVDEEIIDEKIAEDEARETMADEDELREDLEIIKEEKAENEAGGMIMPVDGVLGDLFTKDKLIYSETLEQWVGHNGIDIIGEEGAIVVAAESGQVVEIYEDGLWGTVLVMDHGDGFKSKYSSLSKELVVEEGAYVNRGEAIGKVGSTALVEMKLGPHVHFELIKNNENVDPLGYIKGFNH